jgi:hypothetical protein
MKLPDARSRPLAAIPSELSGLAKLVGCPWCFAELMLVLDETGRGTTPLDVFSYALAPPEIPGRFNIKGGWINSSSHRCEPALSVFLRAERAGSGR